MKPDPASSLSDDELHVLVDGQVSAFDQARLRTRLSTDPASQIRFEQWQQQREALRGLHAEVLHEAVPPALLQAAQQVGAARQTGNQWRRYGGLAASVLMAFGAGWLANSSWQSVRDPNHPMPQQALAQLEHNFVHQAGLAHSVYTPEVRHPVEVSALEQAHLVQWLSKRLGKPLKVPDLSPQGFELVGGRLLPGDTGARAQFMFQNTAGTRVTLYLGAVGVTTPTGLSTQESGFRYEQEAGVPSFYWLDQGFGYALAGQLPRDALMKLADRVYQQL